MPLQTLQYFPCLGLIVTEQFFPLQGGWALAEDDDDADAPLTCPGLIVFSRSRRRGRLLLVVVCPPNEAATCTRISMWVRKPAGAAEDITDGACCMDGEGREARVSRVSG